MSLLDTLRFRECRVSETLSLIVSIFSNAASATVVGNEIINDFSCHSQEKTLELAMNRFASASSISH